MSRCQVTVQRGEMPLSCTVYEVMKCRPAPCAPYAMNVSAGHATFAFDVRVRRTTSLRFIDDALSIMPAFANLIKSRR